MNTLEWALLLALCCAIGAWWPVYRAGQGDAHRQAREAEARVRADAKLRGLDSIAYANGRRDGFLVGYRSAMADGSDEDVLELPVDLSPKAAADVRLSE